MGAPARPRSSQQSLTVFSAGGDDRYGGARGPVVPNELVFGSTDPQAPSVPVGAARQERDYPPEKRARRRTRVSSKDDASKRVESALQRFKAASQQGSQVVGAVAATVPTDPRTPGAPMAKRSMEVDSTSEEGGSVAGGSVRRYRGASADRGSRRGKEANSPAAGGNEQPYGADGEDESAVARTGSREMEGRAHRRTSRVTQALDAFRNASVGFVDGERQRETEVSGRQRTSTRPQSNVDSEWGSRSVVDVEDDGWGTAFRQTARDETRGWMGSDTEGAAVDRSSTTSNDKPTPQIEWLSDEEVQRVVPVIPQPSQYSYYQNGDIVQRVGGSFAVLVIATAFTQAAPLAVGAATFPFWGPLVQATARNLPVRDFNCCGLWFAQVFDVDWQPNPSQLYRGRRKVMSQREKPQWVVSVVVGDDSGARTRVEVESNCPPGSLSPGDDIEMLVVTPDQSLRTFKVIRELYLPQSRFWLSDYPFINRRAFLTLSAAFRKIRGST